MPWFDREIFWPTLVPPTAAQIAANDQMRDGWKASVRNGNWDAQSEVALEEARRMYDAEQERRKGADTKAGVYLAAVTALIPVLVSLLPSLWSEKASKVLGALSLTVFAIAVIYVLRAGYSAFCVLRVSAANTVGATDISQTWDTSQPVASLAKNIAIKVIDNYPGNNAKVSHIKLAHGYLLRSFFVFALLLAVQALWPSAAWVVEEVTKLMAPAVRQPLMMCYS
ncbi:hypothetical protein [Pseudomonas sp. nanlin1]|uniref:hypothetical protein n=1 Tax=Pseudomonas sp. nanlin1 TaxID=3040605 RepID=UPI003890B82D